MSDNDKKNALKNLYADASTYAKNTWISKNGIKALEKYKKDQNVD
jgi:phage terminase large subunit